MPSGVGVRFPPWAPITKYVMEQQDPNENNEVANYDYSDAPEWAVPREWFIQGRYDLDNDTSEFTEPL
jgi:hypothetical protein